VYVLTFDIANGHSGWRAQYNTLLYVVVIAQVFYLSTYVSAVSHLRQTWRDR